MKTIHKLSSGQMLIEIVVAIGVIALVLIGVSDLMIRSAKVATFQKQKNEAVTIIDAILNSYRSRRDTDPQDFYNTVTGEVLDPCVANKPYVCTITIDKTADAVLVTIKAEWDDGGQTYSVTLSQSLTRNKR